MLVVAVVLAGMGVTLFTLDKFWLLIVTEAVVFSVIFLSITVITGMAGQISLCQATFAAVGGFTSAASSTTWPSRCSSPWRSAPWSPASSAASWRSRCSVSGIYLALATLAFALMFDSVIVPLKWVGGGLLPLKVLLPRVPSPVTTRSSCSPWPCWAPSGSS